MAYDEQLAERVREALGRRTIFEERKMFGGLCFLVRGSMACGIVNRDLMVRVGTERYEAALGEPHVRPMDFTGRPLRGMVYVNALGTREDAAVDRWVAAGVAAPPAAKPPRPRKAKPSARTRAARPGLSCA